MKLCLFNDSSNLFSYLILKFKIIQIEQIPVLNAINGDIIVDAAETSSFSLMQREFFCAALDGPITYTGSPLSHVHHGRGITKHHFALYVNHLLDTLRDCGINDQKVNEIIGRINTYADEITGDTGHTG